MVHLLRRRGLGIVLFLAICFISGGTGLELRGYWITPAVCAVNFPCQNGPGTDDVTGDPVECTAAPNNFQDICGDLPDSCHVPSPRTYNKCPGLSQKGKCTMESIKCDVP